MRLPSKDSILKLTLNTLRFRYAFQWVLAYRQITNKILSADTFFDVLDKINVYIAKNSLDPAYSVLTGTMLQRQSVQALLHSYPAIREEILKAIPLATPIQGDLFFEEDITNDAKWDKLYIKWYKSPTKLAKAHLPTLVEVLEDHNDIRLAMVSILKPDAQIHPHEGPWKGSIRVHLGIDVPSDDRCYISVSGRQYYWKNGKILAFDDTFVHHVENGSKDLRVILFLDVERKMRTWHSKFVVWFLNRTLARLTARE